MENPETSPDRPGPLRPDLLVAGFAVYRGLLDPAAQQLLAAALQGVADLAPPFSPEIPGGGRMSVRMTSAGRLGWFADRSGYRYVDRHPGGQPWPAIPALALAVWRQVSGAGRDPDCCLINHYGEGARMGLHQDRDEADFAFPVVSVSLGDDALFRMGGTTRRAPTRSLWLVSGDVVVMGGPARLAYHGIDRVRFGSSRLLPAGGRINITMRVAG